MAMLPPRKQRQLTVLDLKPVARAVGARIREARLAAGMSQRQLAAGRYTPAYISALETGSAKPSVAALFHLAGQLDCNPGDFLQPNFPLERHVRELIAAGVRVTDSHIYIEFADGVELGVPLSWFPALQNASMRDLRNWRISPDGSRIYWTDLDVRVSVPALLGSTADQPAGAGSTPASR